MLLWQPTIETSLLMGHFSLRIVNLCQLVSLLGYSVVQVLRKVDMIRKNAVESVQAERNILISARNPFVVCASGCLYYNCLQEDFQ